MKIKYKLSSIIFFVVILVSAVNYELLAVTVESLLTKRLETAEAVFATSLAAKLIRPTIEDNQTEVVATLMQEKLIRNDKFSYLLVFDKDGKLFAHTFLTQIPQAIFHLNNNFDTDEQYRIDHLHNTDLQVYNVSVPIKEGIIQVGTLHIGISMDFISDTASPLKNASKNIILLALVMTVFGGLLALLGSHALTKSLTQLEEWAMRLSQGEYDADIKIESRDEIAHLAESFKHMRDNIQSAHNALEENNLNLEKQVARRTAELAKNHQELQTSHNQLKKMTEDLELQRKNLKIVFSAIDYPLYVVNLDHSIVMMNDRAQEFVATTAHTQLHCYEVSYNSSNPCKSELNPCPMQELLRTRQPVTLEHQHTDADGKTIYTEVRAFPIFDDQGEVVQMVESFIDITAKKQAEEEKLQLERGLHRAAKMESIGTLAAGVAHEINTPIQFIGDNTDFTSDAIDDLFALVEKYRELLEKLAGDSKEILKQVEQIEEEMDLEYIQEELPSALSQTKEGINQVARIVKAMKDFSHFGSEDQMVQEDLNKAIKTTLMITKNEWKYVAEVIEDLDQNLPQVVCSIGEIKQVLLNLVVNGAHAISERIKNDTILHRGTIRISTSHKDDVVTVAVSDNGMGIAEEHRDKLYDHFFTTKEVGVGTGQGLSMAYHIIVDKHGGKIWFETEVGKGTTFYFTLKSVRSFQA